MPPLPIAIQCMTMDEARLVMWTLQSVLEPVSPEPKTSELLQVLNASSTVWNLLSHNQDGFYAVAIGLPVGIHHTRYPLLDISSTELLNDVMSSSNSAIKSASGFVFPNWKQFDTFWEALAFMVVKGDEEHLPLLVPAADNMGPSTGKLSFCH